jgi:NDP-sugar pyrophosphorylase family protein
MMAVILAGGMGTRLRPYTMTIPKPLLPLGDVPIIEIVLQQLAAAGCTRVVLTLGHMAHLLTASVGTGEKFGLRIDYFVEDQPLGTAGSLRRIRELDEHFLVMNGDLLTTIDYRALFEFHRSKGSWGTISLAEREVRIEYGVVVPDATGLLEDYIEKPTVPYRVSMGINVLARAAVDLIPEDRKFDMPDLMLALRRAGKPVYCFTSGCYWRDIGRFDDYQEASEDFVNERERFLPPR